MPAAAETATLLVSCPDRRGIVAALAQVLYGHGANILDADQHTDVAAGQFFQRIRFDLSRAAHRPRERSSARSREVAERFAHDLAARATRAQRKRVAIFVSRYDHCLYDLLLRHRAGELACEIALIVSNHPELAPVAAQFGVPFQRLPDHDGDQGASRRRARSSCSSAERIDLVVLARYMQILSGEFIARFPQPHHQHPPLVPAGVHAAASPTTRRTSAA